MAFAWRLATCIVNPHRVRNTSVFCSIENLLLLGSSVLQKKPTGVGWTGGGQVWGACGQALTTDPDLAL